MPRHNPLFRSGSDPEGQFDHWLDALVSGTPESETSPHDSTGQLAWAQAGARQLHDLAAQSVKTSGVIPARQRIKENLMHNGVLNAPWRGATWTAQRQQERHAHWWSLNSPVVSGALIIALIVVLGAGFIWNQRPAPGPTDAPGFAVSSPGATPEGGSLSCGAPGYRPVVTSDVDADALAVIDETQEPIVYDEHELVVPLTDGENATLPATTFPMEGMPGIYLHYHEDGITVFNVSLGERWEFTHLDLSAEVSGNVYSVSTFVEIGPYIVGPADSAGFDWTILDTRTGESITTSELLGGTFPWMAVPQSWAPNDGGSDYQAVQFIRARAFLPEISEARLAPEESAVTNRELGDTIAVVLPGGVDDATVIDVSGINGRYSNPGFSVVSFSNDETLVAWRGWSGSGYDDGPYSFFVAEIGDIDNPMVQVEVDSPSVSNPISFSPDDTTLYVRVNNEIRVIGIPDGTMTEVMTSEFTAAQILSVNQEAGTVIFSVATLETWLLDTATGDLTRQQDLDGYDFYLPLGESDLATAQKYGVGELGSGEGSTQSNILVNTATSEIVAEETQPTVNLQQPWFPARLAASDNVVISADSGGSFRVVDLATSSTWSLELPDAGVDVTEPTTFTDLEISPNGECVLFSLYEEVGREGTTVQGTVVTDHIGTWVAPLEPGAGWTQLNIELIDWWEVPNEPAAETLPAQEFSTPTATPQAFEPDLQLAHYGPVNLREFPRLTAAIVTTLPPRTALIATGDISTPSPQPTPTDESDLRWANVRTESGETGWIREIDLEPYSGMPREDTASPVATLPATPEPASIGQLIPRNVVPVISPEPWNILDRSVAGGIGESGLTLPLQNGELYRLPDGASVSQVLHTDIAIVEDHDGSRFSLDLETGEQLASLYPDDPDEQIFGLYQLSPANDEMTAWRILDLLTGDEATTEELFGAPFDTPAIPVVIAVDLAHPSAMLIRFVVPESSTGELEPVSDESSTLLIPGSLGQARVPDQNYGLPFGLPQPVALHSGVDATLLAYVTDAPQPGIVIENATTGESVATFTPDDLVAEVGVVIEGFDADAGVYLAGFNDNGTSLTVWSGSTVSMLKLDGNPRVVAYAPASAPIEMVYLTESSALVKTSQPVGAIGLTASWKHLDLESGSWTDLPELEGFRVDRAAPGIPWMVLDSFSDSGLQSTVIVDTATGEIAARLDEPDVSTASSRSPSRDFGVIVINRFTGDGRTTAYVLDAISGESWEIVPPQFSGGISYEVSPDGALLIANGAGPETWIAPISPDPEWTSIGHHTIDSWLYYPQDMDEVRAIQPSPAQDVSTPVATTDAFEPEFQTLPDRINLRALPTVSSEFVTTLPPGTPLMYVGTGQEPDSPRTEPDTDDQYSDYVWVNVRTEAGEQGWIREIDLEPITPQAHQENIVDTAAALQTEQDSISATATAFAESAPDGAISPNSVEEVVQVDLEGVLNGDERAIGGAQQEITETFRPYLDAGNCHAGFLLLSGRAPDIAQGIQIAEEVFELMLSTVPEVFAETEFHGEAAYETVALPNTTPSGEVLLHVFLYSGCELLETEE